MAQSVHIEVVVAPSFYEIGARLAAIGATAEPLILAGSQRSQFWGAQRTLARLRTATPVQTGTLQRGWFAEERDAGVAIQNDAVNLAGEPYLHHVIFGHGALTAPTEGGKKAYDWPGIEGGHPVHSIAAVPPHDFVSPVLEEAGFDLSLSTGMVTHGILTSMAALARGRPSIPLPGEPSMSSTV